MKIKEAKWNHFLNFKFLRILAMYEANCKNQRLRDILAYNSATSTKPYNHFDKMTPYNVGPDVDAISHSKYP